MCGIAGIIKFSLAPPPDPAVLSNMSQALAHRGPDGHGTFIDPRPNKSAALLHRRLAILDLPGGHQPMSNETGTVHVVFNGEIYNHAALRHQLQAAGGGGHHFKSDHSDTEVLVHGWEQWGPDLPGKLTGMFAFAIWDTRPNPGAGDSAPRDTLFLARDRLGQKPLFYATLDDGIAFASTLPALLANPDIPRRVPREQLALYLQLGYFPPPHTPYRDISQLQPAHWLRLRRDLLDGSPYWSPLPHLETEISNLKSQISNPSASLRSLLSSAVQSQLLSDVPIACFLSGGIDSSIIAALMQNAARAQNAPPIHTVSVGFGGGAESSFDETAHAAAVAAHLGTRHTRLEVNPAQNPLETLQLLMQKSLGQPFADSSILPTYHLSQAVRQIAPVALAGDGGDELFAGYDRYRAMQLLQRWSPLARLLPRTSPLGTLKSRERYRRLTAAAREPDPATRYTRLLEITDPITLQALLGDSPIPNSQFPITPPATSAFRISHSAFRSALFRDQFDYLPGDLLAKVDSAAMSHALEVRAPFLDHHLVQFANALPDHALLSRGTSKHILRQTFAQDLPPQILSRPKQGFAVPIGTWFQTSLRNPLHDLLLAANSFSTTHLRRRTLETLLWEHHSATRDHTHRLFALLMLELWAAQFKPTVE